MPRRPVLSIGLALCAGCVASKPPAPASGPAEAAPAPGLPRFDAAARVEREPDPGRAVPDVASAPTESGPASLPSRPLPPSRPGERILKRGDGRLSKFFAVRPERGEKLGAYIERYCEIPRDRIEILPKADLAEFHNLKDPAPAAVKGTPIDVSDWIVVTGSADEIERVDRFFNLYCASVPQIEIEARIAEITSSNLRDLGAVFSADRLASVGPVVLERFGTNFPNQATGTSPIEGALNLSTIQSDFEYRATLDFLETRQGVDIISNPRIAVRNGGRAEILTGTEIPYLETQTIQGGNINSTIRYKVVGVKLYVVPYLSGADTISLEVDLEVSASTGVSTVTGTIPNPVISTRSARTLVNIRDGSTFVIGGLLATNQVETESRVPLLGAIPLVGALFRSSFEQKQYTEVLFFLTPRVLAEETAHGDLIVPVG